MPPVQLNLTEESPGAKVAPVRCAVAPPISGLLSIEGIPVEGLVDTGASVTCLGFAIWWRYRAQWGALEQFTSAVHGAHLAIVVSVLGELTKIIRCERKSTVGNSEKFFRSVSSPFPFSIFHKCLNVVRSFRKELWHYERICLLWERNKLATKGKEELWS